MALDIIGNVVDKNNKEIKGVKVTDGVVTTTTNEDGYYEIKTEKTLLSFSLAGYPPKAIDLKSYKNPSSINLDVTLDGASAKNDLDAVLNGGSTTNKDDKKESKKEDTKNPKVSEEQEGDKTSKIFLVVGVLAVLGLVGFLAFKKMKNS
jgi:hypothetical protein